MRATTLVQRYTYGHFSDIPSLDSETDLLCGISVRQQESVLLARAQIHALEEAQRAIVGSNITSASMICRGLAIRAEQLRLEIKGGAASVVKALEGLSDRIAGELTEIRWELIQLQANSAQVLEVLRRPRSTEAQELLRQGVRLLENDKIDQAEECFTLALSLDRIDYQVLMNLSAVELRRNNAERAIAFVEEALILPQGLDVRARADALWHLARIHYASEKYAEAFAVGRKSVALIAEPRRALQVGIYAMLGGDLSVGLTLISDAIQSDPSLYDLTVSTPDLVHYNAQILPMLGNLFIQALDRLRYILSKCWSEVSSVDRLGSIASSHKSQYRHAVEHFAQVAYEPSYLECCRALQQLSALQKVPEELRKLHDVQLSLQACALAESAAARELTIEEKRFLGLWKFPRFSAVVFGAAAYFVPGFAVQIAFANVKLDVGYLPDAVVATVVILGFSVWIFSIYWVGRMAFAVLKRCGNDIASAEQYLQQQRKMHQMYQRERADSERSVAILMAAAQLD